MLASEKWKEAISLVVTMVAAGGLSVLIFPPMIEHMFGSGQRGQQSMRNFKESSIEDFISRLKGFYGFLNDQIFGGLLTYIAVVCLLGIVIYWLKDKPASQKPRKQHKKSKKHKLQKQVVTGQKIRWILLVVPGMLYFITVSKIAVYITERYQQPVYAVLIAGIIGLVCLVTKKIFTKKYRVILVLLLAVMTINSWRNAPWGKQQKASEPLLNMSETHAALDCIYVYDARWKVQPSFCDVSQYNSVTFFKEKNLGMLNDSECRNNAEFILYITNSCNHQAVLDSVIASCPAVSGFEQLGSWGYVNVYRLYGTV